MQILSLGLIKLSVVMFYRRIFCTGVRTFTSVSVVAMSVLITAWTLAFFFLFTFYCGGHPSRAWGTVVDIVEHCPNTLNDELALGISDLIIDILIMAMPIPAVSIPDYSMMF